MKFNFEKTYDGDAVFYWYDITSYLKRTFGDILSKAFVCLGQGYNDDSEEDIWRLENKLECRVAEIERKMCESESFYFDYLQDVKLYFNNGKVVNIDSMEGFTIK